MATRLNGKNCPQIEKMLIYRVLYVLRNVALMMLGLIVVTTSILELIFAPMLTLKYYAPSMYKQGMTNAVISFFYMTCVCVQIFNFLASLSIFVSIFLTGYHEKMISYDTMTLASVSLSFTLILHKTLTGIDFYKTYIERDIYVQISSIGDVRCTRKLCFNTDVYTWHQMNKCCGWDSAQDLIGIISGSNKTLRIPQFCCLQSSSLQSRTCTLNSVNRFLSTCYHLRSSFMMLRSVSFISHPALLWYALLKMFAALAFTFAKQHSLLPQAEGLYSYYIPP